MAESVKTYQELIEVDTVSHIFKNISFKDVGCSLCHKPYKSLECPSQRSIIEMEVSSSITPNDTSSSSSDSRSCSPIRDYSSQRPRYFDRSRSYSRSPNRYDRGNSSRYDSYDARDYYNRPRGNDRYYQSRNDHPRYNNNGMRDLIAIIHSVLADATIAMTIIQHLANNSKVKEAIKANTRVVTVPVVMVRIHTINMVIEARI